jgi:hypothetical protein
MFEELQQLGRNVKALAGIVQNEIPIIADDELMRWVDLVNKNINEINSLKEDVIRYYQD